MALVAVNKNGSEWIYDSEPLYENGVWEVAVWDNCVQLPQGTIKKLIGRELTWNDEPVEL